MVAVEKNAAKGVAAERGATRLLVVGDSFFLGNARIDFYANRDFAGYAANWLLDRPVLLEGVAPKSISEYRLQITSIQMQTVQWILLAAIPPQEIGASHESEEHLVLGNHGGRFVRGDSSLRLFQAKT
jgi:hypothetical protein